MDKLAYIRRGLLSWYDLHQRDLPWRKDRSTPPDPYRIWLAEVMLQQTTVASVTPRYQRFLKLWPHITDLALAHIDDVLGEWAGLGYYARARNLHACAQKIYSEHNGKFPQDYNALRALPGIGEYTASAILAIAFNKKSGAVDGNIRRILCRLYGITDPKQAQSKSLQPLAFSLCPRKRPGDFTEALMDLGATICTAKKPACKNCPLARSCLGKSEPSIYPPPTRRPDQPQRYTVIYILRRKRMTFLIRRPDKGLLAGLASFPTSPWVDTAPSELSRFLKEHVPTNLPSTIVWNRLAPTVDHIFTHLRLKAYVAVGYADQSINLKEGWWAHESELETMPSLMQKARHIAFTAEAV